jgi:hypothetical protein
MFNTFSKSATPTDTFLGLLASVGNASGTSTQPLERTSRRARRYSRLSRG